MSSKKLHIVAFDVPYPADYGGAIEVFYKLKALYEEGVEIYFHAFFYGNRKPSNELEKYCKKVFYYKRFFHVNRFVNKLPFIVYSRKNDELLRNLKSIDAPILFEGIHTTYYLKHPDLKSRFKMVRMHNIEHEYYKHLSINEEKPLKKQFFKQESKKLKKYEPVLSHSAVIFAISPLEQQYFTTHFPKNKVIYLPAFHPFKFEKTANESKKYILYHGNLEVSENITAVDWILDHIAKKINHQVVIAGKNPTQKIIEKATKIKNVKIIQNPSFLEMEQLIKKAHIHLLITHQTTGIKLKLLAALFSGKFCLVNKEMIEGTGLESLCEIAKTPKEFIEKIDFLMHKEISDDTINHNIKMFNETFDNSINARLIKELL
ncbi:MAG: hypothetical protein Kow0079_06110 [Vicingaceae bacterium]